MIRLDCSMHARVYICIPSCHAFTNDIKDRHSVGNLYYLEATFIFFALSIISAEKNLLRK